MKATSFMRSLCGLLGGGLMALTLPMAEAIAVSEADLLEKLTTVPVFVLADRDGGYITPQADFPNDDLGRIALLQVFFNESDAKTLVAELQESDPGFNRGGSIGVTDLATIHRLAQEEREVPLKIVFVPQASDLEAARTLDPNFGGENTSSLVPLFTILDGDNNLIPLAFGDEDPAFSMFFSNSDANAVLSSVNEAQPALQARIGVVSFGEFTQRMLDSEDSSFDQVRFLQAADVVNQLQELDLQ